MTGAAGGKATAEILTKHNKLNKFISFTQFPFSVIQRRKSKETEAVLSIRITGLQNSNRVIIFESSNLIYGRSLNLGHGGLAGAHGQRV